MICKFGLLSCKVCKACANNKLCFLVVIVNVSLLVHLVKLLTYVDKGTHANGGRLVTIMFLMPRLLILHILYINPSIIVSINAGIAYK